MNIQRYQLIMGKVNILQKNHMTTIAVHEYLHESLWGL